MTCLCASGSASFPIGVLHNVKLLLGMFIQEVTVEGLCLCVSSGCEVEILGVRPSFCEKYFYNPSEKNLTDAVINALQVLR